jgi:hypothetical protein
MSPIGPDLPIAAPQQFVGNQRQSGLSGDSPNPSKGFPSTILSTKGGHHGDVGRANESPAGRGRRGLRRLTIGVSEDDLSVIAEHGYEGATSTDHDQRAQALSRLITDMLAARSARVTALQGSQRRFSNGATPFRSSGK